MNLSYVKDYLRERRNSISAEDVDELVQKINDFQGTESTFTDISKVMRTINTYNLSFLTQVSEYEAIPSKESKTLPKRIDKAREILCTLSSLSTYLALSLANIKESTFNMKNIRTYMNDLAEKKEHFKSEKMAWVTVLKSLTQEMNFVVEMRRMDIEDKVGYSKYTR